MEMTSAEFAAKTGGPPEDDDLERVNCEQAGEILHRGCGWCAEHDGPMFVCMCRVAARAIQSPEGGA